MGIFDFFRKKPAVESRVIKLDKITEYLDKLPQTRYKQLFEDIQAHRGKLHDVATGISALVEHLNREPLQNKNIPVKHISIMEGNRINYVKNYRTFIADIVMSEHAEEIPSNCARLRKQVLSLAESTEKNQAILKEFFSATIFRINKGMIDLSREIDLLERATTAPFFITIAEIKELQLKYAQKKKREQDLQDEIAQLEEQKSLFRDKEKKLVKLISDLQSSKEYAAYGQNKDTLREVLDEQKRISTPLLQDFAVLQKALIKYKRQSGHERLIDDYLTNVLDTLKKDEHLRIVSILRDIRSLLATEDLSLDARRTAKTLEAIDRLTEAQLMSDRQKLIACEEQKEDLQSRMKRDTAALSIEQQKNYLQQNILRVQAIEHEQAKLQDELAALPFSSLLDTMGKKLEQLTDMPTKVMTDD